MLKCIFLRIGLLNDWSHVIGNFIHNVCFSSYVFFWENNSRTRIDGTLYTLHERVQHFVDSFR
jgi:hypothetical protein